MNYINFIYNKLNNDHKMNISEQNFVDLQYSTYTQLRNNRIQKLPVNELTIHIYNSLNNSIIYCFDKPNIELNDISFCLLKCQGLSTTLSMDTRVLLVMG